MRSHGHPRADRRPPPSDSLGTPNSVHRPAPLAGSLLKGPHLSITRRAFAEMLVPRIGDRACSTCQFDQYESRRAAHPAGVWVGAAKHHIDLVLRNECCRVCSLTATNRGLPGNANRQSTQVAQHAVTPFTYKNPVARRKLTGPSPCILASISMNAFLPKNLTAEGPPVTNRPPARTSLRR